jgi:hypothetical protein
MAGRGGALIRRVLLLLTVVALMAAMMAMSAVSASAGVPTFDKDFCKATDGFFFKNQGQCIKATKGGSAIAV